MRESYIPILIQFIVVIAFVVVTIAATHLLGPKRNSSKKLKSFECGVESQGNARQPFAVKFFLVAILFVLFDVEIIFFYPWAVNFKELGFAGFIEMFIFVVFVMFGLLYVIKKKALKWD